MKFPDEFTLEITKQDFADSLEFLSQDGEAYIYYCNNCLVGQALWGNLKVIHPDAETAICIVDVGEFHLAGIDDFSGAKFGLATKFGQHATMAFYAADEAGKAAITAFDDLSNGGEDFKNGRLQRLTVENMEGEMGRAFPFTVIFTLVKEDTGSLRPLPDSKEAKGK